MTYFTLVKCQITWNPQIIYIITTLRFADGIVVFANTKKEIMSIITNIQTASSRLELYLTHTKTKYMTRGLMKKILNNK